MMTVQFLAVCALLVVGVNSITVGERYPISGGTSVTGADISATIYLGSDSIVFNGQSYNYFYLNTNGYVTFGGKYGQSPRPLDTFDAENHKMISAFWANTEPQCGGISYQVLKSGDALQRASEDVMHANVPRMGTFTATAVVVINFINVKPRGSLMTCNSAPGNTFQLVLATDNVVSYAFFLYESLNWDQSSNGQYAIAAIGSGGGALNVIEDVHSFSGSSDVYKLPDEAGNVVKDGAMQKGFFIMDIDSLKNPALLAMRVTEMMAQLQMMMTVVQALPEKPINPYIHPARVQAANPYYPGYAFAQRAYMAGGLNARLQEAYPEERPNMPQGFSD